MMKNINIVIRLNITMKSLWNHTQFRESRCLQSWRSLCLDWNRHHKPRQKYSIFFQFARDWIRTGYFFFGIDQNESNVVEKWPLFDLFVLFICFLFRVLGPTREIFIHMETTMTGEWFQLLTFTLYSWTLSCEGSLVLYYTYCDMGHQFRIVISKDRAAQHSHL